MSLFSSKDRILTALFLLSLTWITPSWGGYNFDQENVPIYSDSENYLKKEEISKYDVYKKKIENEEKKKDHYPDKTDREMTDNNEKKNRLDSRIFVLPEGRYIDTIPRMSLN